MFVIAFFSPRPSFGNPETRTLLLQPQLLRALSGFAHTLAGDYVWLKSYLVGEVGVGDDNLEVPMLQEITVAQIVLDPHFTVPARYAATYLASIQKRSDVSIELLTFSQSLNPDRFDLLFGEALIRVNYEVPNSSDRLVELAKRIEPLPEKSKIIGSMLMDDWMIGAISYARSQENRNKLIEADLLELLKNTENPRRKELILRELEAVRSQNGS
ncbi:MAG: hypothetical protein LBE89_06255 [Helicobacteraceae bacterium]|nr:hypothetical protein [Helicobacteraceae bacterium]